MIVRLKTAMHASFDIPTPIGIVKVSAETSGKVELRHGDLPVVLSNGMTVERTIACVLRVWPDKMVNKVQFTAQLDNAAINGYPETGQYLDCQTWRDENWVMSIGTEDQEALNIRLPELGIVEDPYPVQYSTSSIRLILKGIQVTSPITFHFIIAFKRLPDDRECSTWFAVEVPHEVANKAVNWTP